MNKYRDTMSRLLKINPSTPVLCDKVMEIAEKADEEVQKLTSALEEIDKRHALAKEEADNIMVKKEFIGALVAKKESDNTEPKMPATLALEKSKLELHCVLESTDNEALRKKIQALEDYRNILELHVTTLTGYCEQLSRGFEHRLSNKSNTATHVKNELFEILGTSDCRTPGEIYSDIRQVLDSFDPDKG